MEVDRGNFEWVNGWEVLAPHLSPSSLGLPPTARVVDIGCGTSSLPLHLSTMYVEVVGVDREAHCTASMTAQHGCSNLLRWLTCDVTAAELDESLPEGCADLVVDKGMLDCALVRSAILAHYHMR